MDLHTVETFVQGASATYWLINYSDFCRRAGFREDYYSEDKWRQWLNLNVTLQSFDTNTLARILGVEVPTRT